MIQSLYLALGSASLMMLINYAIGKPGSEFSPYEIFSSYTVWLSKMRLQKLGLYNQYLRQFEESRPRTAAESIELTNDFKRILYNAAEPFFTWERAFGMCSICTGFWVSLFIGIVFYENLLYLLSVIVISHVLIRVFNKII